MKFTTERNSAIRIVLFLIFCGYCSFGFALETPVLALEDANKLYRPGDALGYWIPNKPVTDIQSLITGEAGADWVRPNRAVPNMGYSQDEHWFRFKVKSFSPSSNWFLVIDYALIRALDLYVVTGQEISQFYQLGDRFEFAARPVDHRNFIVPLTIKKHEELTFYLRIKSDYALQLPVFLVNQARYLKYEITSNLLHGLFFGFLVVMAFYNLFLFFSTKDSSYFFYVCFTISVGLFQLSQHGFGYQYIWPTNIWWQHRATPISCCLAFVFSALFVQSFLETKQNLPRYHAYIRWFLNLSLVSLGVALILSEFVAQAFNSLLAIVGALLLFVTAIKSWRLQVPAARFFVMAWFIFLVAIVTFAVNKLGVAPRNFWTEYGAQIGTAIELSLLSLALADRINTSRRTQEELLEQSRVYEQIAQAANERALNYERMGKQRLEKNIRSRTQQLQNALKDLTLANNQLEALSTVDNLTGLRNLNYFNDKLNEEWMRGIRDRADLSLVLVSVDQFELIGDRYGYVAADEILKKLAITIQERVARPADLVARTGVAEFAILMPNTSRDGACHVAKDIYSYAASEPLNLGVCSISVSVTISVVCELPSYDVKASDLLRHAQDLLLVAIENGGNQWVVDDQEST